MCKECRKAEIEFKKLRAEVEILGHVPEYVSKGMSDNFVCSCGWKSNGYWDGAEWAWDEWEKHAKQILKAGQARLNL